MAGHARRSGRRGVLRPWLALIVLTGGQERLATVAGAQCPVVEVHADQLPPQDHLALWAHAQLDAAGGSLDSGISRLLAPFAMRPTTDYLACLVPTFEAGRLAGLGQPVADPLSDAPAGARQRERQPPGVRLMDVHHDRERRPGDARRVRLTARDLSSTQPAAGPRRRCRHRRRRRTHRATARRAPAGGRDADVERQRVRCGCRHVARRTGAHGGGRRAGRRTADLRQHGAGSTNVSAVGRTGSTWTRGGASPPARRGDGPRSSGGAGRRGVATGRRHRPCPARATGRAPGRSRRVAAARPDGRAAHRVVRARHDGAGVGPHRRPVRIDPAGTRRRERGADSHARLAHAAHRRHQAAAAARQAGRGSAGRSRCRTRR